LRGSGGGVSTGDVDYLPPLRDVLVAPSPALFGSGQK